MNTALKLGGFVAVLVAALAVSFGIGSAVGPVTEPTIDTPSNEHRMEDAR